MISLSDIKFCEGHGDGEDCYEVAVGIGGARGTRWCREGYTAVCGHEFVSATVLTGVIADASGNGDIGKGGTVTLDPEVTNIPALVYSGYIKVDRIPGNQPDNVDRPDSTTPAQDATGAETPAEQADPSPAKNPVKKAAMKTAADQPQE